MTSISFSITRVNRLRRAAERARTLPDEHPDEWPEPTYAERGTTRKVVMHIRHPVVTETIYRATDTYRADSYDCKTGTTVLCTGDSGIVY